MAVTPLQAPDAAADPDVDVMQALLAQLPGASDIVMIVRIAAVHDDTTLPRRQTSAMSARLSDRRWSAGSASLSAFFRMSKPSA